MLSMGRPSHLKTIRNGSAEPLPVGRTPNCNGRDILLIDCPFSMACHKVRGRRNVVAFEEPIIHFEEMLRRQKP